MRHLALAEYLLTSAHDLASHDLQLFLLSYICTINEYNLSGSVLIEDRFTSILWYEYDVILT